ncbi:unnamed protein product, partial [marine sediment metagenome]
MRILHMWMNLYKYTILIQPESIAIVQFELVGGVDKSNESSESAAITSSKTIKGYNFFPIFVIIPFIIII